MKPSYGALAEYRPQRRKAGVEAELPGRKPNYGRWLRRKQATMRFVHPARTKKMSPLRAIPNKQRRGWISFLPAVEKSRPRQPQLLGNTSLHFVRMRTGESIRLPLARQRLP
jgi:hypothetical protein